MKVAVFFRVVFFISVGVLLSCQENHPRFDDLSTVSVRNNDDRYLTYVQPILNKRCVVCHGCYDAPCQLKLSSAEGVKRGANPELVYDGTRLVAADPKRLFTDAHTVPAWRDKGFFSVTDALPGVGSENSVMYDMLHLKTLNPMTSIVEDNARLPEDAFDFSLNRSDTCPTQDTFPRYAEVHPLRGMPYGLPNLTDEEVMILKYWLKAGAPVAAPPEINARLQTEVDRWETFFNGNSLKQQLVSRYLYEHLFLANLYFPDARKTSTQVPSFFRLVRSSTPPGENVSVIATRRPYDNPGVDRIYYRLQLVQDAITAKNHLPYALDQQRMDWLNKLFMDLPFKVTRLPGYAPQQASNPFKTYADIPARSRYRFLLQEARFTINGFMKGSVCRGQIALNVINDRFWVFFVDPDQQRFENLDSFLKQHSDQLSLPAERESNAGVLGYWTEYSGLQAGYLETKSKKLMDILAEGEGLSLDWIWHGDGNNSNAALTVFRHFDSASVETGLIGNNPKTAWLIDYPILERIHYLLVAGFDVYGNVGHQLSTRLYMDFLRMEGEFNFLALLPIKARISLREQWYRGASKKVKDYVYGRHAYLDMEPEIDYPMDVPAKDFLFDKLKQELQLVLSGAHNLTESLAVSEKDKRVLGKLQRLKGAAATLMPEMGLLMIEQENGSLSVFTIIRNSDHSHITSVLFESSNRVPENDTLTVIAGVTGAYPDAIWYVKSGSLGRFVEKITQQSQEKDYQDLMSHYGIRRSHGSFWMISDQLHRIYQQGDPVEYGLLDFNRLENR